MDWLWITLGILLLLLGIIGSVAPVLPGPPLSFLALLLLQLTTRPPFSTQTLVLWGAVATAITILDYMIPVWGTRRFGGTSWGTRGSIAGLILGLFLGPPGVILGPFAGAVIGELLGGKDMSFALRSGFGAFLGFIAGTFMKLIFALTMCFLFIRALW
mgnify:CR=1 FL=1